MKPDHLFWIALAAYALHILEEYTYNWKSWANNILKLDTDWNNFYVTNVIVLFFGLCCAEVGWSHPTFSLVFPALMIVNAIYFHILPYIRSERKFSPGMITGILLFLPIGFSCFKLAVVMRVHTQSLIIAGVAGILLMAFPVVMLKTKDLSFFKQ